MTAIEPDKTYLGIICRKCGEPAPFVEVEEGTRLGETGGDFQIQCPHCGHDDRYLASELRTMTVHRKH